MLDKFRKEDAELNEAINSAFQDLKAFSADDEGYQKTLDQISKLYKLKNDEEKLQLEAAVADAKNTLEREQYSNQLEKDNRPFYRRVDPNTLLVVLSNIYIGLKVLDYEKTGVVTSKLWHFTQKP